MWYRAGAVTTVNGSKNIVGVDTLWTTQASVGDIFTLTGEPIYEIESVSDDTHIGLKTVYTGASGSAQAYAIVRNFTSTTTSLIAQKLANMIDSWHLTLDQLLAWETSTAATVPMTNPATQVTTQVKPIAGLIADIDVAKTASGTSNTPAGNISATTVQAAINELDADIDVAKTASGTSNTPAGNISATTVQAAINELDAEKAALSGASFTGPLLVTTAAPLGYGPGAGGTVFQATSKTTDVTLNKPAGIVFTHNSELPAGGVATLVVNNSFVGSTDNVVVTQGWGNEAYRIQVQDVNNGYFKVQLENRLSSSMSEGIRFNFTIFKGASA